MKHRLILLPLLLLFSLAASAQQSSKSKSKERFREKSPFGNKVVVRYAARINTPYNDFAPAWYKDGLVYLTPSREVGLGQKDSKFQLHFSIFDQNNDPGLATPFSLRLPKDMGPTSFSNNYKKMYITRNFSAVGASGNYELNIFELEEGYPEYTNEVRLPFNSADYSCMHPSISPDGRRLFFASDMPGGIGGFDIWYVEKRGKSWSDPVNLGPSVNSENQEVFPFISASGTLYFSSDGHNSLGGMDVFFVNNPTENPEEVVNLGDPFNTSADDMAFIIDVEGKTGYFTSNRPGGDGGDDIYRFEIPQGVEGVAKPVVEQANVVVRDAKTGQVIQGASVFILEPSEDGFVSQNKDLYAIDMLPVQDKPNAWSLQIVRKNSPDLGRPDLFTNNDGVALTDFIQYKNYLVFVSYKGYRTAERFLSTESIKNGIIEFRLKEAPPCLKAGGLVSTTQFNTRIANAKLRFVHKSTGYEELVRTNINGQFDACLPIDGEYAVYVEREGFEAGSFSVNATRNVPAYSEIKLKPTDVGASAETNMELASGLHEGSVIIMDRIFYEYNKATLNQSAVRHFDALFEMLQRYPEMEIDLIAHTDSRGDAALNMDLTVERAKNAKIYLEYRGIAPGRINPVGKGEMEIRNRCTEGVECSDEEHQVNNRIEIRVRHITKP